MLIECVPNISEGCREEVIQAVVAAVRNTDGAQVLHIDSGFDANRTVITFAGAPEPVELAAYALIQKAAELIDMQIQKGEHPRIGSTDVCPFVPLEGATLADCAAIARRVGERAGKELGIPIYLYEAAATAPHRRNLADIRRGEYEGFAGKMADPAWSPDFGPTSLNLRTGATVVGARRFLIAFNVNLDTTETNVARAIAAKIRTAGPAEGRPNRLGACKAIGWFMPSFGCAQVSMNLIDYELTGLYEAYSACVLEATKLGVRVTGSELVGMLPRAALVDAGEKFAEGVESDEAHSILSAIYSLGLNQFQLFLPEERIVEQRLRTPR